MVEGTVKFFNDMKNFGFIDGDDGKSYFVHATGLKEGVSITEGDRVSFKAVTGEKGLKAEEVEKIEGEKPAEAPKKEAPAEKKEEAPAEEAPAEEEKPAEEAEKKEE
ncbi:MAG: cold-shock protein [Candidatus Aenigmatarchaeota archaeon]